MISLSIQLYWIFICCTIYTEYKDDIHADFVTQFEKSTIFKAFEKVQRMPEDDFKLVMLRLCGSSSREPSEVMINEVIEFRKIVTDIYFGDNNKLSKQFIFRTYFGDQDILKNTCYYAASLKLLINFVNMWVEFYINGENWMKKNRLTTDELYKVYYSEPRLDRRKYFNLIEFRLEPMLWLDKHTKLILYEYHHYLLKYCKYINYHVKKFRDCYGRTGDSAVVNNLRRSYIKDITRINSLDKEVTVKLGKSYMHSTVFDDPEKFSNKELRFDSFNFVGEPCYVNHCKKPDNSLIKKLIKDKTVIRIKSPIELEFYLQIFHYYAEINDKPIFIKLSKCEDQWLIKVNCISSVPYKDILLQAKMKYDKTRELSSKKTSKDICIQVPRKGNNKFITFNGVRPLDHLPEKYHILPCLSLSCGHCIGTVDLIERFYLRDKDGTERDLRTDICPVCHQPACVDYYMEHYSSVNLDSEND
ncbi:hypothetical protein P3W45_001027 [Vairimorpha bombi]|jgi:hypothetical protein